MDLFPGNFKRSGLRALVMTGEPDIKRLDSSEAILIRDLWNRSGLSHRPAGRDSQERIKRMIDQGKEVYFGIYEQNELIGVILTTHDGRKGWLNRLAVDRLWRGRGYAKRLIRHAEEYLHEEGIEIVAALIEEWNKESLALFQDCGYILHDDIRYLTKRDYPEV